MQRQSLGSPGAKLQINGASGGGDKEERRRSAPGAVAMTVAEEEQIKAEKLIRSNLRTERSIHLIPLLTFLCLLLLYLISHDPTPKELEKLGGDARLLFDNAGSATDIRRNTGAGIGGVTAIRSHRGLKEARKLRQGGPKGRARATGIAQALRTVPAVIWIPPSNSWRALQASMRLR